MTPLRVLLVGDHEEDFFLIREMLERNRGLIAADLDHARSLEEARELMQHRPYGLLLFDHDAGDDEAFHSADRRC
jgi:CheY-like chemotaxis protein